MQTFFSNKILVGVIITVISIGALWGVWKALGGNTTVSVGPVDLKVVVSDWQQGSASASATLVEYSDFQCPACKAYAPLVERVVKDNSTTLHFVYRHYPLPQHQHAKLAAQYAEAAGIQGKFFEMHDKLFSGQSDWEKSNKPEDTFIKYAQDLKLDIKKLKTDVTSSEVQKGIDDDIASGTAAGVDATPSFFLNGKKITSPQSLDEFNTLIKESQKR